MQRIISNLNNEEGSAIVMALIVLAMLTIIGIVSTSDTVFDLQIVRNEAIYRRNFYRAESAIVEAGQRLEKSDAGDSLPISTSYTWLSNASTAPDLADMASWKDTADPPNWENRSEASNNMDDPADTSARNNTRYAVTCDGIAAGNSLSMTGGGNLYAYSIYGLFDSTANQGRSLIRMGYYKSF